MELAKLVAAILASLGGGGLLVLSMSGWLGRVWAERLQANTVAKHQAELEELRFKHTSLITQLNELAADARTRISALGALQNTTIGIAHAKVVDAQRELWGGVLAIRSAVGAQLLHHQLYTTEEIPKLYKVIADYLPSQLDKDFRQRNLDLAGGFESVRPLVGEELWTRFHVYRAFSFRLAWKAEQCAKNGRFYPWNQTPDGKPDAGTTQLVSAMFSESELEAMKVDPGHAHEILRAIEQKILAAMNDQLFGSHYVSLSADQQKQMRAIAVVEAANQHLIGPS